MRRRAGVVAQSAAMHATSIPLPPAGAIGVWAFDLAAVEPDETPSEAERARASRFAKPALARRYLASRSVLRAILGAWCDEAPRDVAIELTGYGQPYLGRRPDRHFSLAHSGDRALVACATVPVGVDLEARAALRDADALAARVLSAAELSRWRDSDAAARDTLLAWSWVAKEAYLKARGIGLAMEPGRVVAPAPPGGTIASLDDDVAAHVRPLAVWPEFADALCAPDLAVPVHLHELGAEGWRAR